MLVKLARNQHLPASINLVKRRTWYVDPPAGEPPATPPAPPVVPPEPKPEAKFTQAELDAIAGRTRKEAADSARKALLKELGLDPDDPEAVKLVKTKLTAAQQAEDAKKSAEDKALEKIAELEKKAADAEAKALATEEKRKATILDTRLEGLASKVGAQFPSDVIEYARRNHTDEVTALLGEGDKFNDTKAQTLIDTIKKARPNFFDMRRGAGTGSHAGGDRGAAAAMDDNAARAANLRAARRDI